LILEIIKLLVSETRGLKIPKMVDMLWLYQAAFYFNWPPTGLEPRIPYIWIQHHSHYLTESGNISYQGYNCKRDYICGVMRSVLASIEADCGLELRPKTIWLVLTTSPFSTQHLGVRAKTWLSRNRGNVSKRSDMSTHSCFRELTTIKILLRVLV
jgi:hypothetical protein